MAPTTWPQPSGLALAPSDFIAGIAAVGELNSVNPHGFEDVVMGVYLRTATVSFDIRDETTYQHLLGFIETLQGTNGTVKMPWFGYTSHLGSGGGSPVVNGAHNAGTSQLATSGWTGTDPRLDQDAMIQVNHDVGGVPVPFVYRVLAAVNGPTPTLTIRPRLKMNLASGAAVYFRVDPPTNVWLYTTMKLRSASGEYGRFTSPMSAEGVTIDFIETLRKAY